MKIRKVKRVYIYNINVAGTPLNLSEENQERAGLKDIFKF